ncbi:MAG: FliH/SctL family protein [Clostridia bacterium]|nr:FliH/SctL family protein [Clostridia bacterium]
METDVNVVNPVNPVNPEAQKVLHEAFAKAKHIVETAKKYGTEQVQETRKRMNEEYTKMKKQGHEEGFAIGLAEGQKLGTDSGYREGYSDGLKNAAEENRRVLNELSLMLEQVEKEKERILQKYEEDIEILALGIAKKIIKQEISSNEQVMAGIIKNAIDTYRNQTWVRIYVSKSQSDTFLKADNNIIKALAEVSDNVKIIPDPDMSDFDCVIEMPNQIIDLGVDVQVKNIEEAIDIGKSQNVS